MFLVYSRVRDKNMLFLSFQRKGCQMNGYGLNFLFKRKIKAVFFVFILFLDNLKAITCGFKKKWKTLK
jgi:hypothetical protein